MIKDIISKRLNILISENNINQRELAEKTGISEVTISRYINGQRIPTVENLVRIAKVFNVSTDYIVGISSPEPAFKVKRVMKKLKELELEIVEVGGIDD
jgi:transcriptional regulator with XRE-family HTH domain